jgi:ABC-type glycerol-3-phosphate transport system substrate-binding protein
MIDDDNHSDGTDTAVNRRRLLRSLGAAGVLGGLAGCSGEQSSTPTTQTVQSTPEPEDTPGNTPTATESAWPDLSGQSIYYLAESSARSYQTMWQGVANRFQAETGCQVTIEFAGHASGYRTRLQQMIQANNPPDVSHTSLNMAATLGDQGALAGHEEIISYWEDLWGEQFKDEYRVQVDGEDKYLPLHSNVMSNWYRADVFDEAPNTWSKELEMARSHDGGEGGTRGYYVPTGVGIWANDMKLLTEGWSLGARVFEYNGNEHEVVLDQEPYASRWSRALSHWEELFQYSNPNSTVDYGAFFTSIGTESVYAAPWVGKHLKINALDAPFAEDITETAPAIPEGNDLRMWGNVQGQAVLSGANEEAGTEFLKFLAHPENCMGYYFGESLQQSPLLQSITEHELFQENWQQMRENGPWTESDLQHQRIQEAELVDWGTETDPVNPHAFEVNTHWPMGRITFDVFIDGLSHEEALAKEADGLRQLIS